jgi:hypothetical protein
LPWDAICSWPNWKVNSSTYLFFAFVALFFNKFPISFRPSSVLLFTLPDGVGRFRHKNAPLCYTYGENLAHRLHLHLKRLFPSIFEHLEIVRSEELMPRGVGRVADSPFTGVSVTLDHSSRLHVDEDDVSYCFIVWLGSDGRFLILLVLGLLDRE